MTLKTTRIQSLAFLLALFLCHCGSSDVNSKSTHLSLNINSSQSFNPNADPGKIENFKLSITGSTLPEPIEKIYPYGTQSATIEGLPANSEVLITLEAINTNDLCVRRGYSSPLKIQSGTNSPANIKMNNVPVFANVRNNAIVYNNRFTPKVFAPGEIHFQISHSFDNSNSLLEDISTNETNFSINSSNAVSILAINANQFNVGEHLLTVEDPDTGESSQINITVLDGTHKKGLPITSGGYLGSLTGQHSNMILQQNIMTAF